MAVRQGCGSHVCVCVCCTIQNTSSPFLRMDPQNTTHTWMSFSLWHGVRRIYPAFTPWTSPIRRSIALHLPLHHSSIKHHHHYFPVHLSISQHIIFWIPCDVSSTTKRQRLCPPILLPFAVPFRVRWFHSLRFTKSKPPVSISPLPPLLLPCTIPSRKVTPGE